MVTIETTAHVGPDGVLRLEIPVQQKDQDVQVVLTVSPQASQESSTQKDDPWSSLREKLAQDPKAASGLRLPAPGSWNMEHPEPLRIDDGSSASEQLVKDRR